MKRSPPLSIPDGVCRGAVPTPPAPHQLLFGYERPVGDSVKQFLEMAVTLERRRLLLAIGACTAVAVLVTASQSRVFVTESTSEATMGAPIVAQEPEMPAQPPSVRITPPPAATGVDPVGAVKVTAVAGTLTDVQMINEQGRTVAGKMSAGNREWVPSEPLGYGRSYTVSATSRGADTATATQVSRFTTVVPDDQTAVTLGSTSGAALTEGASYGVGTVIVARFDDPIPDRAAAERQMQVSSTPAVEGSWYWVNDQKAHWRPKKYFPAGTKVSVDAGIYGANLGAGLYGQRDSRVNFTIGPSHVTVVDDVTKQVNVYVDGELVRTMPTSMGRGGTETVGGKTIAFWTQPGVYTVMEKQNPVLMDSSTYGLPVDSASGYKISVPHAVRISPDGIYLHEREATVWAQGNTNVSAGCLNLSADNAEWFYDFAQPGDVVEIRNTGGAPLEQWQNGDWSVPWETWKAGSALRSPS